MHPDAELLKGERGSHDHFQRLFVLRVVGPVPHKLGDRLIADALDDVVTRIAASA
jgi:hypothetical protein